MDSRRLTPGAVVSVRLNKRDLQLVTAVAAREDMTRSEFIRDAIRKMSHRVLLESESWNNEKPQG